MGNAFELPSVINVATPVYFHLFMVGWITQLIFGVAWWLFPKDYNSTKNNEKLAWILYILFNISLLIRAIAEPQNTLNQGGIWSKLLLVSALLHLISGFMYVYILWPRVRGKKIKVLNLGDK